MKIQIVCPIKTGASVFNLISPLVSELGYQCYAADMFAPFMAKNKLPQALGYLMVSNLKDFKNFYDSEDLILIGSCARDAKPDKVIVLYPELMEAEEELLEQQYFYKNTFLTVSEIESKCSTPRELLEVLKSTLDGKPANQYGLC